MRMRAPDRSSLRTAPARPWVRPRGGAGLGTTRLPGATRRRCPVIIWTGRTVDPVPRNIYFFLELSPDSAPCRIRAQTPLGQDRFPLDEGPRGSGDPGG